MTEIFNFGNPTDPDNNDGGQVYTMGCEWESSVVGSVTGGRWRAPTNPPATQCRMALFRVSDLAKVAESNLFTATPNADNDVSFTSPFTIAAATRYVSAIVTDRYVFTLAGWPFTTTHMTAPSGVNGRLATTTAGVAVYPSTIHASAANFFVGPIFDPSTGLTTSLGLITETDTALANTYVRTKALSLLTETDIALPMSFSGGVQNIDTHGWMPKVGRHCAYLQPVSATYVKRRPAIITAVHPDGTVNLRVGHHSETYTNVPRRSAFHLVSSFVSF